MNLLALDLATQVGWALFDSSGRVIESGTFSLGKACTLNERMRRLWTWLGRMTASYHGCRIAMEGPALRSSNLRHGASLAAVAMLAAQVNGLSLVEVAPSELKKHATTKGNAGKPEMIAAAKARFPFVEVEDDNHADALLVGAWALDQVEDWGDA